MFSASCRRKSREPRTSEIGSTSARATGPASRNVASEKGRPARNASVGAAEHGRPDAAVGDRGRLDLLAVPLDPNARAKRGDVHLLALGDLVELDDLVAAWLQRDQHSGDDLVGCDDASASARCGSPSIATRRAAAHADQFQLGLEDHQETERVGDRRAVCDVADQRGDIADLR